MTCFAVQKSDSMVCTVCNLGWDVNDPAAPKCNKPLNAGRTCLKCGTIWGLNEHPPVCRTSNTGVLCQPKSYGCFNRQDFKPCVSHSSLTVNWPFTMSSSCMYTESSTDRMCRGCKHAN